MSVILLFGHRQFSGKDTCCDFLESFLTKRGISYYRNSFAKRLKQQVAERYNLSFELMENTEYKKSKPDHLGGRTVREVLIQEGNFARSIWTPTWAWATYEPIFKANHPISFISDFRFPNEYDDYDKLYNLYEDTTPEPNEKPKIVRVHVFRPNGIFNNDGADGELPDDFEYWDYNIVNEERPDWKQYLMNNLRDILENENVI